MNLTPNQQSVLLALSSEWQTPIQITSKLPKESRNLSNVNQLLKDFIHEGFVQVNPVVLGMYRLTVDGTAMKDELLKQ